MSSIHALEHEMQKKRIDLFSLESFQNQDDKIILKKRRFSSPIDWLACHFDPIHKKPYLTDIHVQMAEQFEQDFMNAQKMPRLTQSWNERIDGGAFSPFKDKFCNESAEKRVQKIIGMAGEYAGLLIRLCCLHEPLRQTEQYYRLPKGTAKIILRKLLDDMTKVYAGE